MIGSTYYSYHVELVGSNVLQSNIEYAVDAFINQGAEAIWYVAKKDVSTNVFRKAYFLLIVALQPFLDLGRIHKMLTISSFLSEVPPVVQTKTRQILLDLVLPFFRQRSCFRCRCSYADRAIDLA